MSFEQCDQFRGMSSYRAELADAAYDDSPLDIGFGATISQPYIVAAMTELLEVSKTHRVLEIGTGSGYQTAILAELAGEVFSIEVVPELAAVRDSNAASTWIRECSRATRRWVSRLAGRCSI